MGGWEEKDKLKMGGWGESKTCPAGLSKLKGYDTITIPENVEGSHSGLVRAPAKRLPW